jgi:hypothetical membrane protein
MEDSMDLNIDSGAAGWLSDRRKIARIAAISGMIGILLPAAGALIAALFYTGRTQEPYSIFNHFISELGNTDWSRFGFVFNTGMILAGVSMIVFQNTLAMLFTTRLRYLLIVVGTLSGVFCSLVGFVPGNHHAAHITVATIFFNLILGSTVLYCLSVLRERDHDFFTRSYALLGVPAIIFLTGFIIDKQLNSEDFVRAHILKVMSDRPQFWFMPFAEWMVFASMLFMIAFVSVSLYRQTSPDISR